MKNIVKTLFTFSILRIPNPALWFILIGGIPLIFIEGAGNDGFEPLSLVLIFLGVVMAIVSIIYNLNQEQK